MASTSQGCGGRRGSATGGGTGIGKIPCKQEERRQHRADHVRGNRHTAELALARLANAVVAIWYPIKLERDTERWSQGLASRLARPTLTAELWLHPRDSRVGLNGSGVLIVNPPYQLGDAMRAWLRELQAALAEPDQRHHSGHSVLEV